MARGKKPLDPLFEADTDALEYIQIIEWIGGGADIPEGDSVRQLTPMSFARVAEVAVDQYASSLRQGTVGEFRKRAQNLIESAGAESIWVAGAWCAIDYLYTEGLITKKARNDSIQAFQAHWDQAYRQSACQAALILRDIEAAIKRKGIRGRPPQSPNGEALIQNIDAAVLREAALPTAEFPNPDQTSIEACIPIVVREFLRLGQLIPLGSTPQESVDTHSKRLRTKLREMIDRR